METRVVGAGLGVLSIVIIPLHHGTGKGLPPVCHGRELAIQFGTPEPGPRFLLLVFAFKPVRDGPALQVVHVLLEGTDLLPATEFNTSPSLSVVGMGSRGLRAAREAIGAVRHLVDDHGRDTRPGGRQVDTLGLGPTVGAGRDGRPVFEGAHDLGGEAAGLSSTFDVDKWH
jgi:hypothetical protein